MIARFAVTATLALGLASCGIFAGDDENTPTIGNRVAVLPGETGIETDVALADTPVVLPAPAPNTDWGQPGGGPAKSPGHVALSQTPTRAWVASIGDGSDGAAHLVSTPVVEQGRVHTIDTRARISAFDAQSGRTLWTRTLSREGENARAAFGGGVSVFGGRVYATSGYGIAVVLNAADGSVVWRQQLDVPLRGAPTVSGGIMLVMTQDNQLLALDAGTGERSWDVIGTVEPAGLLGAASPAVAQGTAIVGFSSGELTAVRMENGRTVWQDALARTGRTTSLAALSDIDAPPVIDGGRVFAIGHGGRMV
ncbi:MAG: PQQ-binding-like beta-propeller repeat protein, partial [Pacificimonas sp.]